MARASDPGISFRTRFVLFVAADHHEYPGSRLSGNPLRAVSPPQHVIRPGQAAFSVRTAWQSHALDSKRCRASSRFSDTMQGFGGVSNGRAPTDIRVGLRNEAFEACWIASLVD